MSVTSDELIQLTIKKLVLKCSVKPPQVTSLPNLKISQRVRLLPILSTPAAKKPNKQNHENQLDSIAVSAIIKGNNLYNKGDFLSALKSYSQAKVIYLRLKSSKYYKILQLEVECQKRLRNYKQTMNLYQQISLIYGGQL